MFLIGMHRYYFFQNEANTDTFIFGTCQYQVPIHVYSLGPEHQTLYFNKLLIEVLSDKYHFWSV